jgi:hypothetical protein
MPTILDATVVNQAYDTSGNGGRKITRLSNGWIVTATKDTTNKAVYLHVSEDGGASFRQLWSVTGLSGIVDISIVSKGTIVYLLMNQGTTPQFVVIDALTGNNLSGYINVDTGQINIGNVSLAINDAGTELHAAWASKNSTYPSSFNIRYAKGTINADGSVTWGAVEQWTKHNTSGDNWGSPTIVVVNGNPIVIAPFAAGTTTMYLTALSPLFGAGAGSYNVGNKTIYGLSGNYPQSSPSAIFVPSSVNGLPNGLIGNAWHGTDSASGGVNYIRFSKSTDLGASWSAPQKLVPGTNPTLTANRNGKLFITYEDNGVTKRIESTDNGDTWSAPITVGNGTNPSSLFDLTFNMSEPLTIRKGATSVLFSGAWVVSEISVTPGYIGQKTSADKSNILTYSITTDGTMSDITEKINGTTIATRTNPTNGQNFTVSLTQEQWDAIKYGNAHTLTITMGSDTWTYTFDKRLNANDDILSAVKGVQDLQTHLNGIKAQLGAAIRAKGGTVNDTDAWSAFVSAVSNMTNKRWASGTATSGASQQFYYPNGSTNSSATLTVSGLSFTPSTVLIFPTNTSSTWITILFPINLPRSTTPNGRITVFSYNPDSSQSALEYTFQLTSPAQVVNGGFTLPVAGTAGTSFTWYAFE